MRKISSALLHFIKSFLFLMIDVRFLIITLLGNSLVFIIAAIMFNLEKNINPNITHYIDALWWSFSTITTVGYGDIVPQTFPGKILGMLTMVIGTGIFATYTGLFAQVFLSEIGKVNSKHLREEIFELKKEIYQLKKSRD